MIDWKKIRSDFPIVKRFNYLDHASASPIPLPVHQEVLRYYQELAGFADFSWNRWVNRREQVRKMVARFINADPEEITFTSSTSHGMNLVAELLSNSGKVLTNLLEFPATTIPWIHRKAKMKFLASKNGTIPIDDIKKNLKRDTAVILTSYVQFQNGFRHNLDEIGKIKGDRYFVVNATQAFGYLPIDVRTSKIDFLMTNSYKWLMAGYGGGVLYMNKKWIKKFKPHSAGWRSTPHPERFNNRIALLKTDASRYEYGCPPFPHIFAVGAAIEYLNRIGQNQIEARILKLTDFALKRLKHLGLKILSPIEKEFRSGIVVFGVKNPEGLTNRLLARKIYVSARGGGIRIAPHIENNEEDILSFIKALREELNK